MRVRSGRVRSTVRVRVETVRVRVGWGAVRVESEGNSEDSHHSLTLFLLLLMSLTGQHHVGACAALGHGSAWARDDGAV